MTPDPFPPARSADDEQTTYLRLVPPCTSTGALKCATPDCTAAAHPSLSWLHLHLRFCAACCRDHPDMMARFNLLWSFASTDSRPTDSN